MTQPKTLTPQEALRALADGKKLTSSVWKNGDFVHLENGDILDECGMKTDIMPIKNYILYTEPKPKRKVANWLTRASEWLESQ